MAQPIPWSLRQAKPAPDDDDDDDGDDDDDDDGGVGGSDDPGDAKPVKPAKVRMCRFTAPQDADWLVSCRPNQLVTRSEFRTARVSARAFLPLPSQSCIENRCC